MTVLSTLALALLFLAAASGKLVDQPRSIATRDRLGIADARWRLIGALELSGAIGVLIGLAIRPLGVAASAGLLLTAIGALTTHLHNDDRAAAMSPAMIALLLAAGTLALQATT
jgi:uncharacterized membrane protein YphA (DoxX/SURF4 family)